MFLKDRQVSSFGCFVFDFWMLRFRDLGALFSSFGCFVLWSSLSSALFSKLLFEMTEISGGNYFLRFSVQVAECLSGRNLNMVLPLLFYGMLS